MFFVQNREEKGLDILKYGERIHRTSVLGPGNRSVIWTHGCCFSCDGCIAEHYKNSIPETCTPAEMAQWFLEDESIFHLTISGGEPMLQPKALYETVRKIKEQRDIGVLVYTGFLYDTLLEKSQNDEDVKNFLSCIDLLIDGPYICEQDSNRPYIGSDNQRIILLTDRYENEVDSYYHQAQGRKVELLFQSDKTMLIGVPGKDQRELWMNLKKMGEI